MTGEKITLRREDLYKEVWANPMTLLAKQYGLSDNGLRKICKKMGIPFPPLGYWAKVQHGKKVTQTLLPQDSSHLNTYEFYKSFKEEKPKPAINPEVEKLIAFENLEENRIAVPTIISRFHPLIKIAKEHFKKRKPNHMGILEPSQDCPDLNVSPTNLDRGLRIFNTILLELEKRKIKISPTNEHRKKLTCILIQGETLNFRLSEKVNQRRLSTQELEALKKKDKYYWGPNYEYKPTGMLTIRIYDGMMDPFKEFTDNSKKLLEDRLNDFIICLHLAAQKIKADRKEREELHQKWELERLQQEEYEKRMKQEKLKTNLLIREAEYWNTAKIIRTFIEEIKNSQLNDPQSFDIENWINWATDKANDLDPLTGNFLQNWNLRVKQEFSKI